MNAFSNWTTIAASKYPWEQDALNFVREQFATHEPYRAWSNFEFTTDDGSLNEVNLLIFGPAGWFLVEIKSSSGTLSGDACKLDFHFVNYNRTEPPRSGDGKPLTGGGIRDEKSIPIAGILANVQLPPGSEIVPVMFISPELTDAKLLKWKPTQGRLRFDVPEFVVYGVVLCHCSRDGRKANPFPGT